MPIVFIANADGIVEPVEVNEEIAEIFVQSDYCDDDLKKDNETHDVMHFDSDAWENMRDLSNLISAEDEFLGVQEDTQIAEDIFYQKQIARCQRIYPKWKAACTNTQWRRFIKNKLHKQTLRKIAADEGCSAMSALRSVKAAIKKLNKFL